MSKTYNFSNKGKAIVETIPVSMDDSMVIKVGNLIIKFSFEQAQSICKDIVENLTQEECPKLNS